MARNGKINTNPSGSSHGEQLVANRLTLMMRYMRDAFITIEEDFFPSFRSLALLLDFIVAKEFAEWHPRNLFQSICHNSEEDRI